MHNSKLAPIAKTILFCVAQSIQRYQLDFMTREFFAILLHIKIQFTLHQDAVILTKFYFNNHRVVYEYINLLNQQNCFKTLYGLKRFFHFNYKPFLSNYCDLRPFKLLHVKWKNQKKSLTSRERETCFSVGVIFLLLI